MEEYTSYWNVMFGPYLYGVNMMGITRVDLSDPEPQVEVIVEAVGLVSRKIDGEFIYYTDEENILYRCNMDGSQPQKLYDQPVHLSGGCFDDQYLYFLLWEDWETWHMHGHHSGELYRMSKENPQEVALLCSFPEGVSIGLVHAVPGYDKLIVEADIGAFDENGDPISDPNSPDGLQGRIEELYLVDKAGGTIQKLEFPKF